MNDCHDGPRFGHAEETAGGFAGPDLTQTASLMPTPVSKARFDLTALIEALPTLGTVLWLERSDWRQMPLAVRVAGRDMLLLEHPALALLSRCRDASAHSEVGSNGPREWVCLRGAAGEVMGKMYLLPDTDCLAWDEMITASNLVVAEPVPERWQPQRAFLRCALACLRSGWRARVLTMQLRDQIWLRSLSAVAPLRMSLLGHELVGNIVRAEGAHWISPLHGA